jgi:signal transduction histidine kinase/DNA-binding response OmpR family regulator
MIDKRGFSILTLPLRHERHVVHARQRARDIAALLGFEHQEQIRLATATSELARNAFRYASGGSVEFKVSEHSPQLFLVSVSDTGPGILNLAQILDGKYVSRTGLGMGILGTRRLMDHFEIISSPSGTLVEAGKLLPASAPLVDSSALRRIAAELAKSGATDPFEEVERQNQELMKTLAELREKQDQLAELNRELEDTNRGVVALYAELDQHADDLRRVSDLKTSFLSNLSHEFRTPLNSITSLCQLLINRSDGNLSAEQEKQVLYIERSAAELTELVNDLLDLAKVEAGKIDVKPRYFEVQDLFGGLRGMLKPLLTGNSLELTFDAAPGLPALYTDEGKVSQILRNLISNALKFTPRGSVRLTAHLEDDGFVAFQVADTGIGIAREDQERIFEEFVQVENELQTRVKGTGLGLPLSKRLVELLGGSIRVESEVGAGSTFHVRLPLHYGELRAQPVQTESVSDLACNATGPFILFIEDNRETSFVHQSSLSGSNYRLLFARSVPEARAVFRTSTPDLVALDRFLDGQDSLFYIQEMKAHGYSGPVVVISVVDDPQTPLAAGADKFLSKPVGPFKLESTLHELLNRRASKKILLVDDDEVTRYLLGGALTKLGFKIVEAQNGREAIQSLADHILGGVLLDVIMPDLTGIEVLREIRHNASMADLPVIIHTSKDLSPEEVKDLSMLGAVIYPKREFSSNEGEEGLRKVLSTAGIGP